MYIQNDRYELKLKYSFKIIKKLYFLIKVPTLEINT